MPVGGMSLVVLKSGGGSALGGLQGLNLIRVRVDRNEDPQVNRLGNSVTLLRETVCITNRHLRGGAPRTRTSETTTLRATGGVRRLINDVGRRHSRGVTLGGRLRHLDR